MNYELAQQLKEAGFPQFVAIGTPYYYDDTKELAVYNPQTMVALESFNKEIHDVAIIPTLSGLIKACWRDSHQFRLDYSREEGYWTACTIWGDGYEDNWCKGSTPIVAVAKLWLELNKQDEKA